MISNFVTLFRMSFVIPLFLVLATIGPSWIALALFLGAGALDVVDGKLARHLNESSELGAMLDLIADRLLTLAAVAGLLAAGTLSLLAASAGLILVARCLFFAAFGEALKGRTALINSKMEPAKILLSFAGLGLAMSPLYNHAFSGLQASDLITWILVAAATLTMYTLFGYARQSVGILSRR
ncbi:MAG: CDP-alcohol phosphatidyltransferase family protein [Hyphomonadaceae bacterium]|nr:CDP-alcohol phosphatidyltransferase family protein [Hyphomonadaceae bacterium]